MKKVVIIEIISGLLGLLFVYAAISKLLEYSIFRLQLTQSPFIGTFARVLVIVLPAVEIVTSVLLVFASLRLFALFASLFLLSLFTAYLVAMLNFSYYLPCSCGGVLAWLTWKQHLILNGVFICITLLAIHLHTSTKSNNKIITAHV